MEEFSIIVGVVLHENKVLVLKRKENKKFDPNKWEFVSGSLDKSENPTDKVIEQVQYETGLDATVEQKGVPFDVKDQYGLWHIYPFLFKSSNADVHIQENDHSNFRWIEPSKVSKLDRVFNLEKNLESFTELEPNRF